MLAIFWGEEVLGGMNTANVLAMWFLHRKPRYAVQHILALVLNSHRLQLR